MHQTRKSILDYLKEHCPATVDDLAEELSLTSVTVRHHLDILRGEGLVDEPFIRHRATPGRPQYAFRLTEKASAHFPKDYEGLTAKILAEIKATAPQTINVIFEGVAERIAAEAPQPKPGQSMPTRLNHAVTFLNQHGYVAHWEKGADGYVLHTNNCPYEAVAKSHPEVCGMDRALVGNLLGAPLECLGRVSEGAGSCAYRVCDPKAAQGTGIKQSGV